MIAAVRYIAFILFLAFCAGLLYESILLTWRRRLERQSKKETQGRFVDTFNRNDSGLGNNWLEEKPHVHDMRQITEFIKQCRTCREFEIAPDAPTGLYDFLVENRRIKGAVLCPSCEREIPRKSDLPQSPFTVNEVKCPYCQFDLKNWNFSDEENN